METKETQACCCGGGKDRFAKVDAILEKFQGVKGALIPVLQEAQHAYGFLPKDVIGRIAETLQIPVSQVFGVVTFYSQFHMNPRGRNIIRVCQGTACHVRGAKNVLKALEDALHVLPGQTTSDERFTLETVACLGACGLAPVLMINDDTHGRLTPETVCQLLDRYQ
jgi:NADH-quinone oxidoreductase subunit E/NADP-reducing hydrogenase subunit HndA